jgi:aspartyl-tRNA synthetase
MSFVGVEDVLDVLEELTAGVFQQVIGVEIQRPFSRISYAEALARFGSDRPDTRIQLELVDLSDAFEESGFRAFRSAVDAGGIVKCLPIHDAQELGRGAVDRLEKFVKKELGAKGLAWIRVAEDGSWQSPIVKFFSDAERAAIAERTDARPGSLLFFQADEAARANGVLARLRTDLGRQLGRVDERRWDVLFVVDFPIFQRDDDGGLTYVHQPFVAPIDEDIPLLATAPEQVRGTHYDVVVNGVELGSGSLRNHRSDVQRRIFETIGYSKQAAEAQFGFLLNALDSGAPPHGGFAYGLDRWVMVLADVDNLRDVIAFPKTQRGQDLLMDAPTVVEQEQLDELQLRIAPPQKRGG